MHRQCSLSLSLLYRTTKENIGRANKFLSQRGLVVQKSQGGSDGLGDKKESSSSCRLTPLCSESACLGAAARLFQGASTGMGEHSVPSCEGPQRWFNSRGSVVWGGKRSTASRSSLRGDCSLMQVSRHLLCAGLLWGGTWEAPGCMCAVGSSGAISKVHFLELWKGRDPRSRQDDHEVSHGALDNNQESNSH